METIGFIEFNSIAKGVEAADAILKASDVTLLFAKPVCPGKYTVMFNGEVAAVTASMDAGKAIADGYVIDFVVIPRVHKAVIEAVNAATLPETVNAVGVMEFFSITAAVYAADAAVKAADVSLIDVRLGTGIGGKSFVILTGETAAVEEAVKCARATISERGLIVSTVVIPNPRKEIFDSLY